MEVPCYVISLKRSTARREHIAREFGREGIPFEFVDAVDAKELCVSTRVSPTLGVPIVSGDIACTMSHGLAMKRVLDSGHERALIFEDDVRLEPGFAGTLGKLLSAPVSWELLKLAGFSTPTYTRFVDHNGHRFVRPMIPSLSGQGYAITSAGARKLVPFMESADEIFDLLMQQLWRTKIEMVEVLPRVVGRTGMASTIDRGTTYQQEPTYLARWKRRLWRARTSVWKRIGR